nr:hypothetical protein [Tanacetum cinerariifolium]
ESVWTVCWAAGRESEWDGLIIVSWIANPNVNQNRNGNVLAAWAKGAGNGNNENQIRCYNCKGMGRLAKNCTVRPRRRDVAYLQTWLLIAQKEKAGIQLQDEEFNLMADAGDLDEIEKVNANYILMENLQQHRHQKSSIVSFTIPLLSHI